MVQALHMHHLLFPLECVCQLRYIYQFAFTTLNYEFSDKSAILLADIQMGSLSQICNFHFYYFSLRFDTSQCRAALAGFQCQRGKRLSLAMCYVSHNTFLGLLAKIKCYVSHTPLNHEICQIRKKTQQQKHKTNYQSESKHLNSPYKNKKCQALRSGENYSIDQTGNLFGIN